MSKRLRIRVITLTMTAVFLVLLLLMGVVNIANYFSGDRAADAILELLAEHGGTFPNQGPGGSGQVFPGMGGGPVPPDVDPGDVDPADDDIDDDDIDDVDPDDYELFGGFDPGVRPGMSEETPFETRFFTVTLDDADQVSSVNTGHIAAVSAEKAADMALRAAEKGRDSAYDGNYKYLRTETDSGDMYIFLDCTRDIESRRSFLKISVLVSLIGFAAIFVLVVLLSPAMIRPTAESFEKQKRFITDAGHELKTPLAVIESCTEVVEMQNGESKWTEGIRDQVKRLSDLTGALVSLARMDESGTAPELSETDFSAIIEETLKPFVLVAEQQGKTLASDIAPGVVIKGSKPPLTQLVSILADNALKYSSDGADIRFRLETSGKHAVLSASNPADGLTAGNRDELFDRFYRGDSSRSSEKKGFGLGLSMARAICEACGGKIGAESPDGNTLVIKAKLPLA